MDFIQALFLSFLHNANEDPMGFLKEIFFSFLQKKAVWIGLKLLSVGILIALYYFSQSKGSVVVNREKEDHSHSKE